MKSMSKNGKIKPLLASLIIGAFSIYHAWSIYTGQPQNFRRIDKLVAETYGINALSILWLILGIACLWYAQRVCRNSLKWH